jgi:O-antigen ligase
MLRDRPWLGFGLGNWPLAYPGYARMDTGLVANQAHSDWIEWAVEGGLPFAAMLAALAVMTIGPAARTRWGIGVIAFWLHCAVDYPSRRPAISIFFFMVAGMVLACQGIMKVWTLSPSNPPPGRTPPMARK